MEKELFYKKLKKIPKSEIHLHSEAVVDRKTVSRILSRKEPEFKDMKNVDKFFSYNSLNEFIEAFLKVQNSYEEISDFSELFNCIKDYMLSNGIVYTELYFSPSMFLNNGWQFEDIINKFVKKIKKLKKKYKLTAKIIVDVSRTFGKENAMKNLDKVIEYNDRKNIIGIGLGGSELNGPAKEFREVFQKAKLYGFHRVAHAGEDDGPNSIWDALKLLDAERIGHGIAAVEDKELVKYLADNKIPLEVCPTSNVFTKRFVKKIEDHPIKYFYDSGIMVTLNTDDPAFFNINILDEYWNLYSKLGFSLGDILKVLINGFNASFAPDKLKKRFVKKAVKAWDKEFKGLT